MVETGSECEGVTVPLLRVSAHTAEGDSAGASGYHLNSVC